MGTKPIGILVNTSLYQGIPIARTRHEVIPFYEEAGEAFNLTPCFFRLQDIRKGSSQVQAYVKAGRSYKKNWITIPEVIHNRTIFNHRRLAHRIKHLESTGKQVFNHWNRYGKLHIYDILMKEVNLRPHLPNTVLATTSSAKHMMSIYDSLIIKPNIGSVGRGIVRIDKINTGWRLSYPKDKWGHTWGTLSFSNHFPRLLQKKFQSHAYVLQQRLPLAAYKGNPFDLRVSVQRDHTGEWQMTGIAGKVAANNKFITNVAQGGAVHTLNNLLEQFPYLEYAQVKQDIEQFSLQVAQQLSRHLPHLADIGLDIGITEFGYPVFIECNNRDLRYSFSRGNMIAEWKASYRNPLGYARFLLDRGKR